MDSRFLTKELVNSALDFVVPAIVALLKECHDEHENVFCVTVQTEDFSVDRQINLEIPQVEAKWRYPYLTFAKTKAAISFRERMATSDLARVAPARFLEGELPWGGGVYECSLVASIGGSGANEDTDEVISYLIGSVIKMFVMRAFVACRKTLE